MFFMYMQNVLPDYTAVQKLFLKIKPVFPELSSQNVLPRFFLKHIVHDTANNMLTAYKLYNK